MTGVFESDTSLLVLFAMSGVSLFISLFFYFKSRFFRRASADLRVNAFDRTFNVFDPYPERRRSVEILVLLPLILVFMFFFIGFVVLKFFEARLILGLTVFMACFGFMMVDEAYEILVNARAFTKAVENKAKLGEGDLKALLLLTEIMPKMSRYYFVLATVFLVSAATFQYIAPSAVLGVSLLVGTTVESTSFAGGISPYLAVFTFTIVFVTVYFAAGRLKTRLFGFSPSTPLTAMEEQFQRVKIMSKWGEAPPYELSHRPVLEDAEVEERKRRALRQEE